MSIASNAKNLVARHGPHNGSTGSDSTPVVQQLKTGLGNWKARESCTAAAVTGGDVNSRLRRCVKIVYAIPDRD